MVEIKEVIDYKYFKGYILGNWMYLDELNLKSFADKRACLRAYVKAINDMIDRDLEGWYSEIPPSNGIAVKLNLHLGAVPAKVNKEGELVFFRLIDDFKRRKKDANIQ